MLWGLVISSCTRPYKLPVPTNLPPQVPSSAIR